MRALSLRTKRPECSCCLQDIFPEVARSLGEGGRVRHGRVVHVRLGDVRRTTVRLAGLWIGFKSSSLTPLAMLVRARSSVSVMVNEEGSRASRLELQIPAGHIRVRVPLIRKDVQLWGTSGSECACRGSSLTQSARGWCRRPSGGSRGEPEQTTQQESE